MLTQIEIRRIDLWSLFKIAFMIYAALGLVSGLFYVFFAMVISGLQDAIIGEDIPGLGILGGALGLFLIPVLALFYGAIGSVFVTIGGFIFNMVVGAVGGLRIEARVPDVGVAPEPPVPPQAPSPAPAPPASPEAPPPDDPATTM